MYWATHFGHVLEKGNVAWLQRYAEELVVLWGMNHFIVWYDPNSFKSNDGADAIAYLNRLAAYLKAAQDMGCSVGALICVNTVPLGSIAKQDQCVGDPWRAPRQACPSRPGMYKYIMEGHEKQLARFKRNGVNLSFVFGWGRDDGGCDCKDCALGVQRVSAAHGLHRRSGQEDRSSRPLGGHERLVH